MSIPRNFALRLLAPLVVACGVAAAQNPDPTAAAKYGWGFRNFSDTMFTWDIYCHSYFGVPVDPNGTWASATFDKLFYEEAFKTKLPSPGGSGSNSSGNCFGLSILSIMINKFGGYYGYCAPTSAYGGDTSRGGGGPSDKALRRIVNIMHGHQLGAAVLETYLDQAQSGHSQNCNNGFQLAKETIGKEGPCLVCITNQPNPADGSGGHVLIAYGTSEESVGHGRIWVVDPNRLWIVNTPKDRGWYQGDSNHIDCDLGSGKWKFRMDGDTTDWPSGNGNLIILSPSMAGVPGRVPSSLGLAIGDLLDKLLLTDSQGDVRRRK